MNVGSVGVIVAGNGCLRPRHRVAPHAPHAPRASSAAPLGWGWRPPPPSRFFAPSRPRGRPRPRKAAAGNGNGKKIQEVYTPSASVCAVAAVDDVATEVDTPFGPVAYPVGTPTLFEDEDEAPPPRPRKRRRVRALSEDDAAAIRHFQSEADAEAAAEAAAAARAEAVAAAEAHWSVVQRAMDFWKDYGWYDPTGLHALAVALGLRGLRERTHARDSEGLHVFCSEMEVSMMNRRADAARLLRDVEALLDGCDVVRAQTFCGTAGTAKAAAASKAAAARATRRLRDRRRREKSAAAAAATAAATATADDDGRRLGRR